MFRPIQCALLVLFLAATVWGTKAGPRRDTLPDPFYPYGKRTPPSRSIFGRLQKLHVTMPHGPKTQSFCLLFLACLCLVCLEVKVSKRKTSKASLMAESLAGALRAGVLDFEEPRRPAPPLWCLWVDPEEEPQPAPEPEQMVSRYRLLGYHEESAAPEIAVVAVRQFGAEYEPSPFVKDEDLTLGIPREYLKPAAAPARPPAKASRALPEPAAGNDPRESIHHLDLLASPA